MTDEAGEDLEDGQERCPVCGLVICPGAMEFCPHYLWSIWDGQLIWEIETAAELKTLAGNFVEMIDDAADDGWLDGIVAAFRDCGSDDFADLAIEAEGLSDEDVLNDRRLMAGEYRETGGMLSGSGCSIFAPLPADSWIKSKKAELRAAIDVIGTQRPQTQ